MLFVLKILLLAPLHVARCIAGIASVVGVPLAGFAVVAGALAWVLLGVPPTAPLVVALMGLIPLVAVFVLTVAIALVKEIGVGHAD